MSTDNRPLNRPDGELVFSGHGRIPVGDTSTMTVPPGTSISFYCSHGDLITDRVGNWIEYTGKATPYESFGPGQTVPDYYLDPPTDLYIKGAPVTVTQPTRLSDLLRPNQGNTHWAACRGILP